MLSILTDVTNAVYTLEIPEQLSDDDVKMYTDRLTEQVNTAQPFGWIFRVFCHALPELWNPTDAYLGDAVCTLCHSDGGRGVRRATHRPGGCHRRRSSKYRQL